MYILLNSWKLSCQVGETRLVKLQGILAKDAVGAAVKKQHGLHRAAHDGDAVLDISKPLRVASRKSDGIAEHRHANRSRGRPTRPVKTGVAAEGELLCRRDRNKGDRGNRANVETADVRFTAHIEAAVRRRFPPAVTGDERTRSVKTQNVAALVHGMVVLPIKNVGDAIDVAAERATGERERIVVALASRGIYWIVDGVIADRGHDGARNDSVQRARTGDAAELHLGEQQLRCIVKSGNVRACQSILQPDSGE